MNVPKTMSTQHPDNVSAPFFASNPELGGDDEIKEAFYSYSHLKCQEQLWDCEGKETDNYVVKKLLTGYEPFFKKNKLGKDFFLTLRVPNPTVEKAEAKILLETLEGIPRSFDTSSLFYQEDIAPIFEVALPMTQSAQDIINISQYYKKFVSGKQDGTVGSTKISQWIGNFKPQSVNVIPLFEEKDSMLGAATEVETYLNTEKASEYQRVWLARSDPALNYGSLTAVLIIKVALQRLHQLQEKTSIDILPILGCGSAPFRGNLNPTNVHNALKGYPSVHTFTLQSAFKFDYPVEQVGKGIRDINRASTSEPTSVNEDKTLQLIEKLTSQYQKEILPLCDLINGVSGFIPSRRKRKLHVGLFGYSRKMGTQVLPRAIKFCGALYSVGIPPEIIGMSCLSQSDIDYIRTIYPSFDQDMGDSLQYLNKDNFEKLAPHLFEHYKPLLNQFNTEPEQKHEKITSIILDNYTKKQSRILSENICRAGFIRRFLG